MLVNMFSSILRSASVMENGQCFDDEFMERPRINSPPLSAIIIHD